MLRLDARLGEIWGFFCPFLLGALLGNQHSSASFRLRPRHVEKFRKSRFADVEKSELGKKETCAKHKIDRSQNGRFKKHTVIRVIPV